MSTCTLEELERVRATAEARIGCCPRAAVAVGIQRGWIRMPGDQARQTDPADPTDPTDPTDPADQTVLVAKDPEEWITLKEAACESGLGSRWLYELVREGTIPSEMVRHQRAIRRADLLAYLESCKR